MTDEADHPRKHERITRDLGRLTVCAAEVAQPRALFGGHLVGALIGVLCFQWFGDALWVYVLSVVLTLRGGWNE